MDYTKKIFNEMPSANMLGVSMLVIFQISAADAGYGGLILSEQAAATGIDYTRFFDYTYEELVAAFDNGELLPDIMVKKTGADGLVETFGGNEGVDAVPDLNYIIFKNYDPVTHADLGFQNNLNISETVYVEQGPTMGTIDTTVLPDVDVTDADTAFDVAGEETSDLVGVFGGNATYELPLWIAVVGVAGILVILVLGLYCFRKSLFPCFYNRSGKEKDFEHSRTVDMERRRLNSEIGTGSQISISASHTLDPAHSSQRRLQEDQIETHEILSAVVLFSGTFIVFYLLQRRFKWFTVSNSS